MNLTTVSKATDFIRSMKYDRWELFMMIPDEIKREVIEQMDECLDQFYTFVWEGDWYMKKLRSDLN